MWGAGLAARIASRFRPCGSAIITAMKIIKSGWALLLAALVWVPASQAQARDITVATWNLGWHMSQAEAAHWIKACGAPFAQGADGRWRPGAGGTSGWDLKWGRDSSVDWDIGTIAPCDVYQVQRRIVPVTERAWRSRDARIAAVLEQRVGADVIAFPEVSGEQAVRDVLPGPAADWQVCSFSGYKVQRTAFAWRTALGATGAKCTVAPALSLPQRAYKEQPRPGLMLELGLGGQRVRFLTVHLKSSCVSPLDSREPNGRGQLAGNEEACTILQAQLEPLRRWYQDATQGADAVVLLGDFNRNLFHDDALPAAPINGRSPSLMHVLQRETPSAWAPRVVPEICPQAGLGSVCAVAKERILDRDEYSRLTRTDALGCRNPIGLDHIVLGGRIESQPAEKVALGPEGWTTATASEEPSLAVSDHCPLRARLTLGAGR
ncbi:hypothetical protein BH09PSE6_BH09PSE6_28340 [soil metagenome]